ncbi:MAG: MBOAT family O-acyltransferase [Flavobacteriales bacterium]|jgi:D-alanyl-lipoteichoic acid acyltransferase DltB (MBOAT superfamily)|nr:MBOAT family O-acyltransferase [Flavobacteriales bacterium]
MLFNSLDFAFFLPIVFALYWLAKRNIKLQNTILLISSYYFYACWDWRFLSLILISSLVDFLVGIALSNQEHVVKRKVLLWTSISVNIGFLAFFKYYNFFVEEFVAVFSMFGREIQANSLNIILPIGISFYTFQTLSYSIDIYKRKLEPSRDFIAFSAFVSFFPQLVAGPIERASNLLPQFLRQRTFDYSNAVMGMQQILWGLFKKMVIADNCAELANMIFNNSADYSGSTLLLGAIFFSFQIYGDFSGYSDIAIGTARLFGIKLMKNFDFPYFSRDIAEFWRRWHISLSSWFRDYVYIPLGGSRVKKAKNIRNVFIVFAVSGLWHGANWTFLIWGILNAIFFLPLLLLDTNRNHLDIVAKGKLFPSFKELIAILSTFGITVLAWVFFRAESLTHAISYLDSMFNLDLFSIPHIMDMPKVKISLVLLTLFVCIEWLGREGAFAIDVLEKKLNGVQRLILYSFIVFLIGMYSPTSENPFIYFQF